MGEVNVIADGWPPLDAVLDAMPFPAVLVDLGSGTVTFANRAALNVSLELLASGDGRLSHYATDPGGAPLVAEETPVRRAARGEEFQSLRVAWQTPRGRMQYVVSSRAVASGDGRAGVVVVTFTDVTHLEAAQGELRQTLRAREEFVSRVTHELKEPLNAMLLSLQFLEAVGGDGALLSARDVLPHVGVLRRQGNRLARLVESLLDVTRINHDRLTLDPEAFDLCDLAREVVGQLRRDDPRASETVSLVACEPTIGYFDRARIEQALGNLLFNALKYGAGRPVTVRVTADDATATLEVSDQGIGIDPTDHARVFERFERATSGHRRQSLGLGLYIVRSIVEAHGGRVRLRSEVGRGSTFAMELPRRRMHGRQDGGG